jgi:ubiquitin carboxyl-terminal hydrolase MINDY-1/2
MDLNPLFTGHTSFRPGGQGGAGSNGGELTLFEQAGIDLVHGWIVDPDTPEAKVMAKWEDYDSAVMLIADADHITKGRLVGDNEQVDEGPSSSSSSSGPPLLKLSKEESEKVEAGVLSMTL